MTQAYAKAVMYHWRLHQWFTRHATKEQFIRYNEIANRQRAIWERIRYIHPHSKEGRALARELQDLELESNAMLEEHKPNYDKAIAEGAPLPGLLGMYPDELEQPKEQINDGE